MSSANKAAEKIRPEYPEQRLYVMDTRCISGGLGLLVENMVQQKEAGAGWEDVIAWGEENKLKIAHRFTVDDLNYLKAGGRVSNASALVGSLLSIKPVLYVPDRGTLDVAKKVRGRKAALRAIIDGVLHDLSKIDPTGLEFRILQADCRDDAAYVRDEIKKAYPQVGRITITGLGAFQRFLYLRIITPGGIPARSDLPPDRAARSGLPQRRCCRPSDPSRGWRGRRILCRLRARAPCSRSR